jgi:hypothetical protein
MLDRRDITVGRCYVNERDGTAREVVEELDRQKVKYNAFDLTTGRLAPEPHQICFKGELASWASREANPREIAMLHPLEPSTWFENIPDTEAKLAEVELTKAIMRQLVEHNTFHRW